MRTISSKEVAEMLGKRHDNFLRDIRKYIVTLGEDAPKYFISSGKSGYEVTLAGCELIAGRIIGVKSTAFREKYGKVLGKIKEDVNKAEPKSIGCSIEEVAKRLGCTERHVYRLIKSGVLNGTQKEILVPVKKMVVLEEDLDAYMKVRGIE